MKPYDILADFFDEMFTDEEYEIWMIVWQQYIYRENINILEVGCGTGRFLSLVDLHQLHIDAIDLSHSMLEKAYKRNLPVNFQQADITHYQKPDFYHRVYAFMDTINYLTDEASLDKAFANIHLSLKEDGLFIFDVHRIDNIALFDEYHETIEFNDQEIFWYSFLDKDNPNLVHHQFKLSEYQETHQQLILDIDDYISLLKPYFVIELCFKNDYRYFIVAQKRRSNA